MKCIAVLRLTLLFLAIPFIVDAQATKVYTVQVGTFLDSKAADFEPIRSLGFVYAQPFENNLFRVFIGSFKKADAAKRVEAQLRQNGYQGASVVEVPIDEKRTASVIQFETLNAKKPIDWNKYSRFSNLYGIIEEETVKLVTGPYSDVEEARQELSRIQKSGFSDAFIKKVPTAQLQRLSTFETGIKQALIPLNLSAGAPAAKAPAPAQVPQSYNNPESARTVPAQMAERSPAAASTLPEIRPNVKRRSALDLQKVLKSEKIYEGSLDGFYGPGTRAAYEKALAGNRELQKYRILARSMKLPVHGGPNDQLQSAIDQLMSNVQAPGVLERSKHPLASAYRAYLLFAQMGPSADVNHLMNTAVRQAYSGKKTGGTPPLDYNATYSYNDLNQLLLHLYYVHLAPDILYVSPCWLLQRHPKQATAALNTALSKSNNQLQLQTCDPFYDWEEARMAAAMAIDLNDAGQVAPEALSRATTQRARLFLAAQALDAQAGNKAFAWNNSLWTGLNGWAASDPLHERLVEAFKVSFFQTQVRLEDYYMDKGFEAEPAKALALATLNTLVGPYLERFL